MTGGIRPGLERRARPGGSSTWPRNVAWRPCAELAEVGGCYELRLSVRGVHPDRLGVELRDDVLVITGSVAQGPYSAGPEESDFHRMIGLPADASRMGVTARLEGDTLVVRVPKTRVASGARLELVRTDAGPGGHTDVPDIGIGESDPGRAG
jgi:HSP20 family molecular chaperone IbpA